jgi:hypothetical protein
LYGVDGTGAQLALGQQQIVEVVLNVCHAQLCGRLTVLLLKCPNFGNVLFLGVLAQSSQFGVETDSFDDLLLCHCRISSRTELGVAAFSIEETAQEESTAAGQHKNHCADLDN